MLPDGNQRWSQQKSTYRPPTEVIKTADYEVAVLTTDKAAKAFIQEHHYSGTYPASRFRFGLFTHGNLVGVAVFSVPMQNKVISNVFPEHNVNDYTELGRFVLLDEVPGNGETWFLGQCFRHLKAKGIRGVISFSDPVPRADVSGQITFPGHIGTIYQAFNGKYLGRGSKTYLNLLPDGTNFSPRALAKIQNGETGWQYAVNQLISYGAAPPEDTDDLRAWVKQQLPNITRRVKHPGNHKYAWALNKHDRKFLTETLQYPKKVDQ